MTTVTHTDAQLENEIHVWLAANSREDEVTVAIQRVADAYNPDRPSAVVISDDPDRPAQMFTWAANTGRYYRDVAGTQDLFHGAAYGQTHLRIWHRDGGEFTDA